MRVYASAEMTLTDTNDGISVTGIDRYYMASSSSSGITVDSQGWKPDPQETNPVSRYHWSYEVVNYSDGAKIPSKPAVIGVYGKDGKEGIDAVTVSLSSEAHTFAGTESRAIASSITIDISAFKGNQRIPTSIGTVTGGISGQLTHSELGRGTTNNKLVINATNALAKSDGTLSIPIVADGRAFNKVFSWSVAFKGKTGDKGDAGPQGPQGIKGPKGSDGTTTYTWIRYADTPTSGMSNSPVGKKYIGLSFNQTNQTESNNYNDYQWSLMPQNIEVGGRNLLPLSDFIAWGAGYQLDGYKFTVTGKNAGFRLPNTHINSSGVQMTLSFKVRKISGSVTHLGGHTGPMQSNIMTYMDGEHISNSFLFDYVNDTDEHHFVTTFTTGDRTTDWIYIQPNRSHYSLDYVLEIWDIKLEKGNTTTDWTPAPEDTQAEIDDAKEQVKKTVKTITEEYYQSTKSDSLAGGRWTETAPTWDANKFMFVRSKITYVDETTDYTPEINLSGAKGDTGDKGDTGPQGPQGPRGATGSQGPRGNTGTSVESVTEYYLATSASSGIVSTNTGFKTTMQPLTATNKYLWNYEKINFSDGTSQPTIPVIIGVYGDKGQTGSTGATGRSIVSITEHYLATSASSGVTRSTSGWKTTMQPTTETNKYLWNYETIKWSSGTLTTYVEPIIIGVHGAKGPQGPQGPQGIQGPSGSNGQSQWVHIRYSPNPTGSGMDTKPSSTTKYVGIAVTNSATAPPFPEFTWSKYVGEDGDRGPQGVKGDKGDDGLDTYTWVRYADEKDGTGIDNFPDGKKFIGLAYNKTTPNESNNPNDYQWSAMYDEEAFKGVGIADKTETLSGTEIYTNKADNAVVHVEVDGETIGGGSGKNIATLRYVEANNSNLSVTKSEEWSYEFYHTYRLTALSSELKYFKWNEHWEQGVRYTASMYVYDPDKHANYITAFHSAAQPTSEVQNVYDLGEGWYRYCVTFTSRVSGRPSHGILLYLKSTTPVGETVWVTGLQLELGDVATSYEMPAPTPDYPIELQSLNDFDVVSSVGRENIYTGEKDIDHVLDMNTYTIASRLPVGKYTISFDYDVIQENMSIVNFLLYSSVSGTFSNVPMKTGSNSRVFRTFTVTDDISKGHIWLYAGRGSAESRANHVVFKDVKIEKGSIATPYSPVLEDITEGDSHPLIDKINLSLDEPLRSVGDVKDRLFRDTDGLWKVERNVANKGIEDMVSVNTYSGPNEYHFDGGVAFLIFYYNNQRSISTTDIKSSHFKKTKSNNYNATGAEVNTIHQLDRTRFSIRVAESTIGVTYANTTQQKVTAFKNWANANDVRIQYILGEPSIEILPQSLQDKLNNLHSFQDSNYVYTVINDKTDVISEMLKPTLYATFKGGGWYSRWKTEDELRKHQAELDSKAGSTELNDTLTIVREEREKLGDLRTDFQSTKSNLLITHSEEWMNTITETANSIGGMSNRIINIEQTKEQIDTFFKFDDALTIAKSNAQTKLRLTNDEIQFLDGETKGTYITGNNMVTQNLTIQDKLNLPNHTMESQEDLTIIRFIG